MYTFDENIVSDLHKDARGYRPSQSWWEMWNESHSSRKQEIWDDLADELEQAMALEELDQARALAKLSDRILETMKLGADDTKTAIKWIIEAEEFDDFDLRCGASYFCFHFGLNYNVANKFPIQEAMNEMLAEVI